MLVVEDDASQVLALTIGLGREGFGVTSVNDGRDAVGAVFAHTPDVILLDVMLPGIGGIEICRELRERGVTTPIIMVSSRTEEVDVVVGIEVGADDYVFKPYRMRELTARIGALMRRRRANHVMTVVSSDPAREAELLSVGDIRLDSDRYEVSIRGQAIDLPLREFQVLRELLARAGRVVTRDELLERIWGIDYDGDPRIVATLIGRIRSRIEADPAEPRHITTIRGVGYRFNDRA